MKKSQWREMPGGRNIELFTLENRNRMQVSVTTYGATIVSLVVPDDQGRLDDVVLGYDDLEGYRSGRDYFGACIGRYANRIAQGRFELDGKTYKLSTNDGENTLHGGIRGFDKKVWHAQTAEAPTGSEAVVMEYTSEDGEEGFPGKMMVRVGYTLTAENELRIEYQARADRDTVINLTNHSYFNFLGSRGGDVLGHEVTIHADQFLPVDASLIPTGEFRPVEETPFDFRKATPIGARIHTNGEQLNFGKGYDHSWVLNRNARDELFLAATVLERTTKRVMKIFTTEPGIQFYSGNLLKGGAGKGGARYYKHHGLCLETQHFPDSPNKPRFPSTVLKKDGTYRSTTVLQFCTGE